MRTQTAIGRLARTAAAALFLLAHAGCQEDQPAAPRSGVAAAEADAPFIKTARGFRIPLDQQEPNAWRPINDGVTIASADQSLRIEYTRTRGAAHGAAFMLPPGSLTDLQSLTIRIAATPAQRLHICLTDADGGVWTFPTARITADSAEITLAAADLKPDLFQNQGRTLPPRPDLSRIQMLTILDISAHMGAPETACTWTIEAVEAVTR